MRPAASKFLRLRLLFCLIISFKRLISLSISILTRKTDLSSPMRHQRAYVSVAILGGSERKEVWSWKWIRDWRDAAGYQQVPININVCCRLEAAELAEVARKKK